jgi:hypothetical protein
MGTWGPENLEIGRVKETLEPGNRGTWEYGNMGTWEPYKPIYKTI